MVRLVLASVVFVLVAACGGPRTPQGELYQAGYDDGCATANALAERRGGGVRQPGSGRLRDRNEPYLRGWSDGHATCAESTIAATSLPPGLGPGLIPLPF